MVKENLEDMSTLIVVPDKRYFDDLTRIMLCYTKISSGNQLRKDRLYLFAAAGIWSSKLLVKGISAAWII